MDDLRRWVNLSLIIGAVIMWWLFASISSTILMNLGASGIDFFSNVTDTQLMGDMIKTSTLIGLVLSLGITIYMWRSKEIYEGGLNVAREMKKVTWPTKDETKSATKVVIITSLILAAILSVFDFFFQWLTALILGVS